MNPYTIHPARIVERRPDAQHIFTFRMRFVDPEVQSAYRFQPGQFNMLYVFGVGEVPISISSDPADLDGFDHTVRIVGRVTGLLDHAERGDVLGLRGPYGSPWPLDAIAGNDVVVVTGGLGCAPVTGAIEYMIRRRASYGRLTIVHGVKTPKDLLYRERFDRWKRTPDTRVLLTVDQPDKTWHYHVGVPLDLFDAIELDPARTAVLMCGPEIMMKLAIRRLVAAGIAPEAIYLSLERNMRCGVGHCGHCQLGGKFVCKDGPILPYPAVRRWFGAAGF